MAILDFVTLFLLPFFFAVLCHVLTGTLKR